MKPVTLLHGPHDETGELDVEQGVLVAEEYTMYVSAKHRQLWLDEVTPVPGREDTYAPIRGIIIAEDFNGSIADVYRSLTEMSAFQFLTSVLIPIGIDLHIFPPDDSVWPTDET